jgi:catechol 2,3-dioxygenase-like lactoylglutathione lyase family enzyme
MLADAQPVCLVAVTDAKKAREFYGDVLGLRFIGEDGFALVFHCGVTQLRVQKVEAFQPQSFTVMGWVVPDIGVVVAGLRSKGVLFRRYAWMTSGTDVWAAPGGALVAWFNDPDGNILSLTQMP